MVGVFSRLSTGGIGHRRNRSAADARQTLAQNVEVLSPAPASTTCGIATAAEFKPVERPIEVVDYDQPVNCPEQEPSTILNDGRTWKERRSSVSSRVRSDLPMAKEGSNL
ncbi:uncharacterized protein A4U43_C04F9790 [Asparagus officinalis]|uniref:Uncharacterized protein n=1 Tax=Asparagus officinalis TaxID=4686 RepID=A0A5P1F520_ASPOF|nr:uncharacterized protein LOC109839794 [Asparagus officinalis]ONK71550.1 uncharacterized protein A4U43_C04F9790 [Asparagus officinalis]